MCQWFVVNNDQNGKILPKNSFKNWQFTTWSLKNWILEGKSTLIRYCKLMSLMTEWEANILLSRFIFNLIKATGSVAPTRFSMVLSSSTSTLGNTYYQLDRFTGMIQILKALHGGIFSEVYNVTAENGVGQTCPTIQIKVWRVVHSLAHQGQKI